MAREIDDRIVAMHFRNEDFEAGAKETLKTLEELRQGLDLEGAADSFKSVSRASDQYLKFDKPNQAVTTLNKALKGLGTVAKSAFNYATGPLRTFAKEAQMLANNMRTWFGIDVARSLEQAAVSTVRAFTIDPIKTGHMEYEEKMESVKTMLNASAETYTKKMQAAGEKEYEMQKAALERQMKADKVSAKERKERLAALEKEYEASKWQYDEDAHLEYITKTLDDLNHYADKTVYSFSDMTTNMAKFVNTGTELEQAAEAVKGISNWAAFAGRGAAEASSAMYNTAQAFGNHYMDAANWRSIMLANMNTQQAEKAFIEMAVAMGTLNRKNGKTYVPGKDIEVMPGGIKDTLQYKWLTNDVMLNTFRAFAGELRDVDLLAAGFAKDDPLIQWFLDLGDKATVAATEVRSFPKMMDTLKEAAQSGWGKTWEYVEGDVKERTKTWTEFATYFSEILDAQSDARNAIFEEWRHYTGGAEGDPIDGRDILIQSLWNIVHTITEIGKAISKAWTDVFGVFDAKTLMRWTQSFEQTTIRVQNWFGYMEDEGSRINKISKILSGVFSVLKFGYDLIKQVADFLSPWFEKMEPYFDKVLTWVADLSEAFTEAVKSKDFTKVFQVFGNGISGLWKSIKDFASKHFGSFLQPIFDFIKAPSWEKFLQLGEKLKDGFKAILDSLKKWYNSSELKKIVDDIRERFTSLFSGLFSDQNGSWKGIDVSGLLAKLGEIFSSVKAWPGWEEMNRFIRENSFLTTIANGIRSLLDALKLLFNPPEQKKTTGKLELPKNAWLIASAGLSDAIPGKAVFEEKETVITKFLHFVENMKAEWEKAKETLLSFIGDIPKGIDELRKGLSVFFGNGEDGTWDGIIDSAVENVGDVGRVAMLFSGAGALSGMGKAFKNFGKLEKVISGRFKSGKTIFDALGGLFTSTGEIPKTIAGNLKDVEGNRNFLKDLVDKFKPFQGVTIGDITDGVRKFDAVATGILKISGSMAILIGCLNWLAEIDKNYTEEQVGTALTILGELAGGLAIFGFMSLFGTNGSSKFGTGILKIAVSFLILIRAFNALIAAVADDSKNKYQNVDKAFVLLEWITTIISIFEAITSVSKVSGANGVEFAFGDGVSLSGMVGFVLALVAIVAELKNLIGVLNDENLKEGSVDKALLILGGITALIGAFEIFSSFKGWSKSLGGNDVNKSFNIDFGGKSSGLIGFMFSIIALVYAVKELAELSGAGADIDSAVDVIGKLTLLIGAFEFLTGIKASSSSGKDFSHFELGGEKTGLIGFAFSIVALVDAIRKLAALEKDGANIKGAVDVLWQLQTLITAFEVFSHLDMGIGGDAFKLTTGGKGAGSGLIGFIIAIEGLILAIYALSILPKDSVDHGVEVLKQLTLMLGAFKALNSSNMSVGKFSLGFGGNNDLRDSVANFADLASFVAAIAVMIAEVAEAGKLPENEAKRGIEIVKTLGILIDSFKVITTANNSLGGTRSIGQQITTGLIDVGELAVFVKAINDLLKSMVRLSKDVDSIEKLEVVTSAMDTIGTAITKFGGVITALGGLTVVAEKAAPTDPTAGWLVGAKAAVNAIEFIGTFIGAAAALEAVLSGVGYLWTDENGKKRSSEEVATEISRWIGDTFIIINAIASAIGEGVGLFGGNLVGAFKGSMDGAQLKATTSGIEQAVDNVKDVTEEQLTHLEGVTSHMKKIVEALPEATLLQRIFGGTDAEVFAGGISKLGQGLYNYFSYVNDITDWSVVTQSTTAIDQLVTSAAKIMEVESGELGSASNALATFLGVIGNPAVYATTWGTSWEDGGMEHGHSYGKSFNAAYDETWKEFCASVTANIASWYTAWSAAGNEHGSLYGSNFTSAFSVKAAELAQIIAAKIDLNPVIRPVLDLTDFNAGVRSMHGSFSNIHINLSGSSVTSPSLLSYADAKESSRQNNIASTVANAMNAGFQQVAASVNGIRVELNGQQVGRATAPYVDSILGVQVAQTLRNRS